MPLTHARSARRAAAAAANFFKSCIWRQETLSTVPPPYYAHRFLNFAEARQRAQRAPAAHVPCCAQRVFVDGGERPAEPRASS